MYYGLVVTLSVIVPLDVLSFSRCSDYDGGCGMWLMVF